MLNVEDRHILLLLLFEVKRKFSPCNMGIIMWVFIYIINTQLFMKKLQIIAHLQTKPPPLSKPHVTKLYSQLLSLITYFLFLCI